MSETTKGRLLIISEYLGFEAGSDYCGGCIKRMDNYTSRHCGEFIEDLELESKYDALNGNVNKYKRCQPCLDSEQAADKMISRAEVEKITHEAKANRKTLRSRVPVLDRVIDRLGKLLNQTDGPNNE